ncbi:MAG: acetate--CoA ligase family protein [Gammaproteobacteria bacterium]|nr:acetate--CoA ligase family protein [Gammaproteobacteria bacterium]
MHADTASGPLRLERLLSPGSVAVVGASARPGSIAAKTISLIRESGFRGDLHLVNPRHATLFDQPCHPDLASLPSVPDLVVYAISGLPLESSFEQALELGAGGILVYAANHLPDDGTPTLPERLRRKAGAAGIPVCGGNSMGFYNYENRVFVSFDRPPERPPGHIALISHSGSAMTYLANNDARFCFNYVISSGQETNGTAADYMHYVLERPSTRVVALFLETVRDVPGFVGALEKARARDIPVVIAKLGRTEKSAAHAFSHSGAIAGNHDAFTALCRRHGALPVRDLDELIVTALLFALECRPTTQAIASILDSGGMREQMIDLAKDHGVEFAEISAGTAGRMSQHLDSGLDADNPLDAMGALGRNSETVFAECGKALLDDPATGLLTCEFEFRDGFSHYPELFRSLETLHGYRDKPVIAVNSLGFSRMQDTAVDLCHRGIACLNGIDLALRGIRNLLHYSAGRAPGTEPSGVAWTPDTNRLRRWRGALRPYGPRTESDCLTLLADFGFPVIPYREANDLEAALAAADALGYPVVLKTAAPGVMHKSGVGGVVTNLQDPGALALAYESLSGRLGSATLVMRQAARGAEIALGMKRDAQFGPLVMVAAGGTQVESLGDRAFGLAPLGYPEAREMWRSLDIHPLLMEALGDACPGQAVLDDLLVRFSVLAGSLSDVITEMDINPLIVNADGLQVVDGLVIAG